MSYLVFETETTGKADFRAPAEAAHQPRLVQLAALLCDESGEEISSLNLIIQPENYEIPKEASDIHGITTEMAYNYGVPCEVAIRAFASLAKPGIIKVAHNISFDRFVLMGEAVRSEWVNFEKILMPGFCTMNAAMPICQLPGNYGDFKWPKLQEAHKHAFGTEFEGAHDALADVRATARLYRWLMERKAVTV